MIISFLKLQDRLWHVMSTCLQLSTHHLSHVKTFNKVDLIRGCMQNYREAVCAISHQYPAQSIATVLSVAQGITMFPRPTSHSPALGPGCTGPSLAHYVPEGADSTSKPTIQQPLSGAAGFLVDPQVAATSRSGQEPWKHTT